MIRQVLLFLICVAAGALVSCSPDYGPDYAKLSEAERLIDTWKLDSAEVLMEQFEGADFSNGRDSALYALNRIRIEKMSGRILPNDSLATVATRFFDDGRHPRRAMLAWYYRACVQFDNRLYSDAMSSARRMKMFADQIDAYLYQARYADIMAYCSELVGDNLSAAKYYTYAFNRYKDRISSDDVGYLNYFFTEARSAWLRAGRIDSALYLSNKMKGIILAKADSVVVSDWISNHATLLLNRQIHDYDGARNLYREMDSIHAKYDPSAPNHRIAKLLIRALADNVPQAMDSALQLESEFGSAHLSYGYFLHDLTPDEMLDMHLAYNLDPICVLGPLTEPNRCAPSVSAGDDGEAAAVDDDNRSMLLAMGVAALVLLFIVAGLIAIRRFRADGK